MLGKIKIGVRKIGSRWQPVDSTGSVVRGDVYNADGTGYITREGAAEAAEMLRVSRTWNPRVPERSHATKPIHVHPTDPGKFIADYVRKDREHLGVELQAACQKPKKTRERDLREIAWAAVDNINHAWEGRLGLITRGDITNAVKHLQRWCTTRSRASKRTHATKRQAHSSRQRR